MGFPDHVTRIYTTIGDCNPVDHCGGWIFEHSQTPGTVDVVWIECPHWEGKWECPECNGCPISDCDQVGCDADTYSDCDGCGESMCIACHGTGERLDLRWEVSHTTVDASEGPDDPHCWIDWESVARSCDRDIEDYRAAFRDKDPARMGWSIYDAASHYGWGEFDHYPEQYTRAEVDALEQGMDRIERAQRAAKGA